MKNGLEKSWITNKIGKTGKKGEGRIRKKIVLGMVEKSTELNNYC